MGRRTAASRVQTPVPPTREGVSPSCVALPPGPWPTVLDFLVHRLPQLTSAAWAQRMRDGDVLNANNQAIGPNEAYTPHSKVYYYRKLAFEHRIPFEEGIVFQDEWLVVADKPHFLPVTPKGRYVQETLLVRLKKRLGLDTLTPMHRLDRETAGLLMFSIQPHTRAAYQNLFRDRLVHKVYQAVAPVNPALHFPLSRHTRLQESERFMAMQEVPGEPNAHTRIDLLTTQGARGLYRLEPSTGQKHQLRAHMNALGLPIEGDRIYPALLPEPALEETPDHSRPLQLLAQSLRFTDPITGALRQFESGLKLNW